MSQPIRVAVLGLGQRGLQHLSALWRLQGEGLVQVAALIDAFEDNLAEAKIRSYVDGFRIEGIHISTDFRGTPRGTAVGCNLFCASSRGSTTAN